MGRTVRQVLLATAVGLAAAGCARGGRPAALEHGEAVVRLELDKALPGDRPMTVCLAAEDGRFVRGLAVAPRYNQVPHDVDASGLGLEGDALAGEIRVTVHSDGFVPPDGTVLRCAYTIDARVEGTAVRGTFEGRLGGAEGGEAGEGQRTAGAVSGEVSAAPALEGPVVMDLHMENAAGEAPSGKGRWGQRGYPSLVFKGGRVVHGLIRGHGGNPINYFEAAVKAMDLEWHGGAVAGTLGVASKGDEYVYTFDGRVVGDRVGGTFEKVFNGRAVRGGRFMGTLAPMPEVAPGDGLYYVELHGAVPEGKQLMLYVPCVGGAFGAGAGFAGTFNHTFHDVDGSGLSLTGRKIAGDVGVTIRADPYVPKDGKSVPCRYTVSAEVADGCVTGTFEGEFGGRAVSGTVVGRVRPRPEAPEPARYNLKLDNGVCDGPPWHRRCYIGFVAAGGEADSGGISNNKGGFQGTFKRASVALDGTAFRATIEATVDSAGQVKTGDYVFTLSGRLVGSELVGTVDTALNGQTVKRGTDFMGSVGPAD